MTAVDEIGRSRYVNLITYRKDGTPVATPVWHVLHEGELFVVTEARSWKVRRIRNNSEVRVTACDFRGRVAPGAPTTTGRARLLDDSETARARALLARRYALSRVGNWFARTLRIRRPPMVGIAVSF
ncbi:PPOX class F420-dependent oxidoreductase [Dactylosporangium roseum]|uniref:PPOX class F420-dependent oxidoreductase n=1 Tax=Dactylosporangium roseum TaxID=47989 RepID=A0ABY5YX36_9ACTN|nr:PPOX class F420-dependent oxidoreductase [Dactylosporangium roseum]UWZ33964.1 PPOX class F420-dependent oxidoreductase [Dactylosporangium roseum]